MATSPPTAWILGVPVHCVSMSEAVDRIAEFIRAGSPHLVITLGTEMVMNAQHDAAFREVARGADLLVPDSIGVVWAARRQGFEVRRVAGIDLLDHLVVQGIKERWRFYFLGGEPGVAEEAAERLVEKHPGMIIAGCQHGYFKDDRAVIERVRTANANILLAAMGSPRQELWCREHGNALGVPVAIGVGGSFDVIAGRARRAPGWMRLVGLEWMYRLLRQPSRSGRMLALPRFAMKVMMEGKGRSG